MSLDEKRRAPTPAELALVDGLLTMLSRRIAGALDLGLVVLLESRDRYANFLSDHVDKPMRAAALMLRLTIAEVVAEPALTPFQAIETETGKFLAALADLSDFVSMPAAALKATVGKLEASHRRLRDSLLDVAERLCFEPSILRDASAERNRASDKILARLNDDLLAERGMVR